MSSLIKRSINFLLVMAIILSPSVFVLAEEGDFIQIQTERLKEDLKKLESMKLLEGDLQNVENEVALRQNALFTIIDISLRENLGLLEMIRNINLSEKIYSQLEWLISKDNDWYQDFILEVNVSYSVGKLKLLATEIQEHRNSIEGLSVRRLIGMVVALEGLKAQKTAQERWEFLNQEMIDKDFSGEKYDEVFSLLDEASDEIDSSYQLIISSQLRLEKMSRPEDLEYAREWLTRSNQSLMRAYGIFNLLAENL